MAYPTGTPSTGVADIYSGTSFTPQSTVLTVRDNYTSVDKASLANSLGVQVALIQNFVNATYLGRADTPVAIAYIDTIHATGSINISGASVQIQESDFDNRIFIGSAGVKITAGPDLTDYVWLDSEGDVVLHAEDQIDIIAGRDAINHGPLNILNTYDDILISPTVGNLSLYAPGGYLYAEFGDKVDIIASGLMFLRNVDPTTDVTITSFKNLGLNASGAVNITATDIGTGGYAVINLLADKETNVRSKADINVYAGYLGGPGNLDITASLAMSVETGTNITLIAGEAFYLETYTTNITMVSANETYLTTLGGDIELSAAASIKMTTIADLDIVLGDNLNIAGLPTSSAGLSAGDVWASGAGKYLIIV